LPRRLRLLAMTKHSGFPEFAGMTCQFLIFPTAFQKMRHCHQIWKSQ
jgi:hypothetical protein